MFIPYPTLSYAKILEKLNQLNLELERQDKFAKIIVTGVLRYRCFQVATVRLEI